MNRRKRHQTMALVMAMTATIALSLAAPATANHQICQWVGDKWVCIPPEEGP